MASSTRLMPSSSTPSSDPALHRPPIYSPAPYHRGSPSSMIMGDLIRNAYEESSSERKVSVAVVDEVTLEEYLSKEAARVPVGFGEDPAPATAPGADKVVLGFGKGRGRKRAGAVDAVDRAAVQRQKRMIKNRESAARSRERKQAYTLELESLVMRLEEENAKLLREQEELRRLRLKELMENLIPVTERTKPKSPRVLRRTHSMEW